MRLLRMMAVAAATCLATQGQALTVTATIDGTDAIFLAGRTDLTIPDPSLPWPGGMVRHTGPTPEEALETLPDAISVSAGDIVRVLDPATGGVNFFNGSAGGLFGPAGNASAGSSTLSAFGDISGYNGTQGALTGVFLTDSIPSGSSPPATLSTAIDILPNTIISPLVGQIFYIGTGEVSAGVFRQFIAPTGATRLFLGIPDGFSFVGPPGAYDDNDGAYRVRVGINSIPAVPLPAAGLMLLAGLAGLGGLKRRKR